ncbi:hypothetical protein [Streptomyces sp. NPDC127190]|uniref:hypothetical protein n=1 Tax=unclassified Streptomyces TaxID=2593676 RepID=UPI00362608F9
MAQPVRAARTADPEAETGGFMRALRITPDTTVRELGLPEPGAQSAIRDHIGTSGAVGQGVYHWQALLHIHGDGRVIGLAQNITAWALASAWRSIALYPIHGPVVVTGRAEDGAVAATPLGMSAPASSAHRVVPVIHAYGALRTAVPEPLRSSLMS